MLFRGSASAVAKDILSGSLHLHLVDQFAYAHGHKPTGSEVKSWERSLPALVNTVRDAGLHEIELLLEYRLPLTNKRADAILAGVHPETGEPSYVVVELKQWSEAHPTEDAPNLCFLPFYSTPRLNPIEQVRGYCDYIAHFNGALHHHQHRIAGVAYLHNATEFGASGLEAAGQSQRARLFTSDRRGQFVDFLTSRLAPASGANAADELLNGKIRPSTQLMSVAAAEIREREQFRLLDQQQVAYETVLHAVRESRRADHKEVVVVTGGPGTGKSVIALQLLGELYRGGSTALHATGSQSFTTTMRRVAGSRKRVVQDLFKYFNSFITAERNGLDVLICDEAHRMRETSAKRYTPAAQRTGKQQVEELIDAARVPVFLLDEHQVVRPGEMGTVPEIKAVAKAKNLRCTVVPLDDQFRCGGSEAYLSWVLRLLELSPGGPVPWQPDNRMQLHVAESPEALEDFLAQRRAEGYGARMTAGYCWSWTKETPPGEELPADVVIGGWARPWNVAGSRAVNGAPPAALWATDPAGFGQVGCVYTAQGFEYDWNGVILGPDLVWRENRWVTHRSSSQDPAFKKSTPDADVDRLIKNTYKVLLTRGMVGTILYSTDPETQSKLRELVEEEPISTIVPAAGS